MKKYNPVVLCCAILLGAVLVWIVTYLRALALQGPHDGITNIATGMHLNVWDWLAVAIAFFSLGVTAYSTWAQYKTMKNTSTLDTKMVWTVMLSFYHNIIRNTIMLYALREVLEKDGYRRYPSEDILDKMNLDFLKLEQIPIQCMTGKNYYYIKGMIELTRIFNIHLGVTQKHLMSSWVGRDVKSHDINNLISQNWMLAFNLYRTMKSIYPNYAGKRGSKTMALSKTVSEIKKYVMSLTGEYYASVKDGDYDTNSRIKLESERFVNAIFGDDSNNADIFINRLNAVVKSRTGIGSDRLPYIILILNS